MREDRKQRDKIMQEINIIELQEIEDIEPMTLPDRKRLREWVYSGHSPSCNPWGYRGNDGEELEYLEALYRHRRIMWGDNYQPFYTIIKNHY